MNIIARIDSRQLKPLWRDIFFYQQVYNFIALLTKLIHLRRLVPSLAISISFTWVLGFKITLVAFAATLCKTYVQFGVATRKQHVLSNFWFVAPFGVYGQEYSYDDVGYRDLWQEERGEAGAEVWSAVVGLLFALVTAVVSASAGHKYGWLQSWHVPNTLLWLSVVNTLPLMGSDGEKLFFHIFESRGFRLSRFVPSVLTLVVAVYWGNTHWENSLVLLVTIPGIFFGTRVLRVIKELVVWEACENQAYRTCGKYRVETLSAEELSEIRRYTLTYALNQGLHRLRPLSTRTALITAIYYISSIAALWWYSSHHL